MNDKALLTIDASGERDPEAVLEAASKAAKVLQKVVEQMPRKIIVGGKQYLQYEAWQTLGQFYSYGARTCEAVPVEIDGVSGAYARAEVIDMRTGLVVGGADAYCLSNEENWIGKPWFQLASMAQTRAGAKALRNRLAWVAVLAGYEPTPAEEMTGHEHDTTKKPEHYCDKHSVAFRRFEKDGKVWYSHKDGEGWCNEAKARETAPEAPRTNGKPETKPEQAKGEKEEIEKLLAQFSQLYKQCKAAGLTELPTFRRPCSLAQAKETVATIQAIWDGSGAEQEVMPV